jgi:hypothetical protein
MYRTLTWATWLLKMTKKKPNPFSIEFLGVSFISRTTTLNGNIEGARSNQTRGALEFRLKFAEMTLFDPTRRIFGDEGS